MAETIKEVLVNLPQDRTIKILEIGAGTGGTTAYILPELKNKNVEYTFSDLSPLFLTKAQEKFQEYNFVNYELLDIVKVSNNNETYDIIVAANVLHATADLKQTLANARKLLNPEGILILVEGTQPIRWFDLTFGMTDGWWKFTDKQLRANYPLISTDKWQEILLENDFSKAIDLCDRNVSQQAVIVAQASRNLNTGDRYLIFTDRQGIGTRVSDRLANLNREYVLVNIGSDFEQIAENKYQINSSYEQCDRLFQKLDRQNKKCNNIIYLPSIDSNKNELDIDRITNSLSFTPKKRARILPMMP